MRKLLWMAFALTAALALSAGCTLDNTYAFCVDSDDCNDTRDTCFLVDIPSANTYGRFCSRQCSSHGQCEFNFGFEGACYSLDGAASICYQTCDFDYDCYSSSICLEVLRTDGLFDYLCVPDN
jgi:hypothetical protein